MLEESYFHETKGGTVFYVWDGIVYRWTGEKFVEVEFSSEDVMDKN